MVYLHNMSNIWNTLERDIHVNNFSLYFAFSIILIIITGARRLVVQQTENRRKR